MSLPFNAPKAQSGKIILVANVLAKDGRGDEVQAALVKVRAAAEASAEKDTHTYRTTRSEEDPHKFLVFEEYTLPNGIVDHVAGDTFQALAAAGIIADLDIKYFYEFK
ncbi:BZ3500_MvSof-1268-A1-R1_Chr9g10884 [Microbotryum saponariae]|uniref:BZ3500_MvSof-1268-A1-R1_Chr9g10884 protein n=1 Tax=Microbotryum saponariae TaxID=289078 RepID=A0A2X0KI22_9BASI|nr:BZ3501_MvSof-1269-A2-R1_Chr9g10632 [Microbotryum saponariae]SDA00859.1 BZ3500_MvSof-1268-A1-R1_Chr9g10884 [Microbotryum saponariae]